MLYALLTTPSLVDVDTQYFLAGACRDEEPPPTTKKIHDDDAWFGKDNDEGSGKDKSGDNNIPGDLYETNFTFLTKRVMALDRDTNECPCLVITDLSKNADTADLPIVNGEITSHRFYAGAPIITDNGVPIGAVFVLCVDPRPEGLSDKNKHCMSFP